MSNQTSFLKLNAVFDTGVSRSLSWRRKQLQGIHDLVQNNSEPLVKAALRDSRLTRAEVLLELASVLELVRSEIDGIKKYSKSSAAFKSSARSSVDSVHQRVASRQLPAGVIVVKSSWSHPYSSVLGAAALAYAAGNVVAYAISDKAVASTLAPLFSTNLDQSGYELLDLSTFDKAHAHILDAVSPSVSLLEVANDGSVYAASVATPLPKSCVVYVHTSGNVKAAAWAIAASKAAFNGQAPLAPTVAFVDDAVYEEFRFELLTALRNTPYRKTSSGGVLSAQGVDVLAQEPCFVVAAPSTKALSILNQLDQSSLVVARVSSPDTAIDRLKTVSNITALFLYSTDPFRTYVSENVDSSYIYFNAIPLKGLVNPWDACSSTLNNTLCKSQDIIQASTSSHIDIYDAKFSSKVNKLIARSSVARLNEGPGTRWDFFQQVKFAFQAAKVVTVVTAVAGGYLAYRRFTK